MAKKKAKFVASPRRRSPWSYIWILAAVAAILFIGSGVWFATVGSDEASNPGQVGPQFTVDQERIDLGRQPLNKLAKAEFQVTNTGDRTLTLDKSTPVKAVEGC